MAQRMSCKDKSRATLRALALTLEKEKEKEKEAALRRLFRELALASPSYRPGTCQWCLDF